MINEFIDNVVSQGAEALLPHFLSPPWLTRLSFSARNFLCDITDDQEHQEIKDIFETEASSLLIVAVTELIHARNSYAPDFDPSDIEEEDMADFLKCYAMAVIFEYIKRHGNIDIPEPEINDIFDEAWFIEIEENNPALTDALYHFMTDTEI